ncbi:MAG: ZIP family metal transporter [Pyrinomonadaceae bacterium]
MSFGKLFLFGGLLALANLVGGLLLTAPFARVRRREQLLRYLIALGAGFMLAAVFIEVLPEAINVRLQDLRDDGDAGQAVRTATTLLLSGYLLIHLVEHTIAPHFHFGAETHPESVIGPSAAYTAIGGLTIHSFFDGVSIASAFLVNFRVGLLVYIAIMLHKVPEGFTAASIMLASGRSPRKAHAAALVIGAATLTGTIGVALLQTRLQGAVAYALPFSAGVTLYVAASDLIPEVNHEEKNPFVSLAVFGGVALFYLLHLTLQK